MAMNGRLTGAVFALASVLSGVVFAQAQAPARRADVNAETRAAAEAGQLIPAGQGPSAQDGVMASTRKRVDVEAETRAAGRAGLLAPTGMVAPKVLEGNGSSWTRADREAQTRAAARSGQLIPAGQGTEVVPKR